jgi:hypothetical protein
MSIISVIILAVVIYYMNFENKPATSTLLSYFSKKSGINENEISVLKRVDEGKYVVLLFSSYNDKDQYFVALYKKNIFNFWPLIAYTNDSSTKGRLVEPSNGISGDKNTIQILYYINTDNKESAKIFYRYKNGNSEMIKDIALTNKYYIEIVYLPPSEGFAYFE